MSTGQAVDWGWMRTSPFHRFRNRIKTVSTGLFINPSEHYNTIENKIMEINLLKFCTSKRKLGLGGGAIWGKFDHQAKFNCYVRDLICDDGSLR